jgi:hypothetical protein
MRSFRPALFLLLALVALLATRARADTPPYPQPPATGGATVLTDTPAGGLPVLSWSPGGGGGGGITALTQDVTASGSGSVPATVVQAQDDAVSFTTAGFTCGAESTTPSPYGHGYILGNVGPSGNYSGVFFGYSFTGVGGTCTTPNNYNLVGNAVSGDTRLNCPGAGNLYFDWQGTAIAQYNGASNPSQWLFGSFNTLNVAFGYHGTGPTPTWDGAAGAIALMDAPTAPTCTPGTYANGVMSGQAGQVHWCDEKGIDHVLSGNTGNTASFVAYVTKGGSDSAGNGSENAPWLTIGHALATISGASSSQPWAVSVGPGTYVENLALANWTFVVGLDPSTAAETIQGNATIGSSFSASSPVGGFSNFTITGDTTIDFSTVSQSAGEIILQNDILSGSFTATGFGVGNDDFVDLYGGATEVLGATSVTGMGIFTQGASFLDTTSITGGTLGGSWTSIGGAISPTFSVTAGSGGLGVLIEGASVTGTLNVVGPVLYQASAGGFPATITCTGGCLTSDFTYQSAANGLGYTPAISGNWSPVPTTIQGALDTIGASIPGMPAAPTVGGAVVLTDTPAAGAAVLTWTAAGSVGAPSVTYTPTTSANWHTVPSTVQGALDNLAAAIPALPPPTVTGAIPIAASSGASVAWSNLSQLPSEGTAIFQTLSGEALINPGASNGGHLRQAGTDLMIWGTPSGGSPQGLGWQPTTIALTNGATNTLTNAQATFFKQTFTGTLTSGTTIVWPAVSGGTWVADLSQLVLSGGIVTFSNGTQSCAVTVSAIVASRPFYWIFTTTGGISCSNG